MKVESGAALNYGLSVGRVLRVEFHAKCSSAQGLLPIQCLALFRVRLLAVYIKNHLFEAVISYTTSLQILNIKVHLLAVYKFTII